MGMYCCCGIKKRDGWICQCDWTEWFLCFEMDYNHDNFPLNIPIKEIPDKDGTYEVRVFEDGDYDEMESEFSLVKKNWGEVTNQAISHWRSEYDDNWMGYRGVYAWKEKPKEEV